MTIPPKGIHENERLARYILYQKYIRRDGSDTIRADAFIPHPYSDLSVTRHIGLDDGQIWKIGQDVASQTKKTLHGRADVVASAFLKQGLKVHSAPLLNNPNHADVSNWPADKPAQKMIAIEIAQASGKVKLTPTQ